MSTFRLDRVRPAAVPRARRPGVAALEPRRLPANLAGTGGPDLFADVQIARAAHGRRLELIPVPGPVASASETAPDWATAWVRRREYAWAVD